MMWTNVAPNLIIAGFLHFFHDPFTDSLVIISTILAIISFFLLALFPLRIYQILKNDENSIVWNPLFEEWDISSPKKKYHVLYDYGIKLAKCAGIVLFYAFQFPQLCVIWVLSWVYFILTLWAKPKKERKKNIVMVIGEGSFAIIESLLIALISLEDDSKKEIVSYVIIGVILFSVTVFIGAMILE